MFKLIVGIAALVIIATFAPWIFVVAGILLAIFLAWWGINFVVEIIRDTARPSETPRISETPAGSHRWDDVMPLLVVGVIVLGYIALISGGA